MEIVENKKAKSKVWEHFGLKKVDGKTVENVAICRICLASVKYSGGTTNLSSYLRARHTALGKPSEVNDADTNPRCNSSETSLDQVIKQEKPCQPHVQTSLPTLFIKKTTYPPNSRHALEITDTVTNFLIHDMRPFKTVETQWFKKMIEKLDPRYTVPSRKQFSQVAIPKKYEEVKIKVKTDIQKAKQVAITTDGWTSRSTESYVTVTSTHVNDDWEMVNYVLMTRCMPDNHTGENIAVFLKEALAEWGIPERPLYIVSDNASNMTKAAEVLSCDFHLGCFAHTLNLAAQKGLRVKAISHLLARIRKIVGYFHRSTVAASLLQVQATNLGLPNHKLIIDVQTRWNSAFDMLERYLEMQVAVVAALISSQLNNVRDKDLKFLADEEITLATLVMETMRPLKQVTTMLCSEKNPTVSTILPLQFKLLKVHQERLPGECSAITSLKSAIADDLKNRYNAGNTQVLMKATVLDPRFKSLPHLSSEQAFATYNDLVRELASNFPNGVVKQEADLHSSQCSQAPNVVVDTEAVQTLPALPTLPDLEENVKSSNDDCSSVSTNPPTPKKAKNDSVLVDLLGDVFVTKVVNMVSPIERAENEIKKYKELPCLPLEGNPFSWWKENEHLLPILSQMAKQLLCIPSTSVPSERVFSTAGDIITAQRASLKAKTVDMLIFLKKNSSSIT